MRGVLVLQVQYAGATAAAVVAVLQTIATHGAVVVRIGVVVHAATGPAAGVCELRFRALAINIHRRIQRHGLAFPGACGRHFRRRLRQHIARRVEGPTLQSRLRRMGRDQSSMRIMCKATDAQIAVNLRHLSRAVVVVQTGAERVRNHRGGESGHASPLPLHVLPATVAAPAHGPGHPGADDMSPRLALQGVALEMKERLAIQGHAANRARVVQRIADDADGSIRFAAGAQALCIPLVAKAEFKLDGSRFCVEQALRFDLGAPPSVTLEFDLTQRRCLRFFACVVLPRVSRLQLSGLAPNVSDLL